MTAPTVDDYGYVTLSAQTAEAIAAECAINGSCSLNWAQDSYTVYALVFTLSPLSIANQSMLSFGGLHPHLQPDAALFLSIMRVGCFGFSVMETPHFHPDYVDEKFGNRLGLNAATQLASLLNSVIRALRSENEPEQPLGALKPEYLNEPGRSQDIQEMGVTLK